MHATMSSPAAAVSAGEAGGEEETETRFSPDAVGESVMSMSCHQSSSTALVTPLSWNHWVGSQHVDGGGHVSFGGACLLKTQWDGEEYIWM